MAFRVKPVVKYMTKAAIEVKAENLLAQYEAQQKRIEKPPIPIEFIVSDLLGFETSSRAIGDPDTVAYIDPNKMVICLNLEKSEYLDEVGPEYTWAHEVGHWVLDHFEDDRRQLSLGIENQPTRLLHRDTRHHQPFRHEFQAEYFASCLLMPKRFLVPLASRLNLLQWASIYSLRETFEVSVTAMKNRLQGLGLIYVKNRRIYRDANEAHGMNRLL